MLRLPHGVALSVVLLTLAAPRHVVAEEAVAPAPGQYASSAAPPPVAPEQDRWSRKVGVLGHIGMLSGPYGFLGVSAEVAPASFVSVALGAGLGIAGPQAAMLVHARPLRGESWAPVLGVGPSFGPYTPALQHLLDECRGHCGTRTYALAAWLNFAAGVEYRARGGFVFRVSGGYSRILNPDGWKCHPGRAPSTGCGEPSGRDALADITFSVGSFF